MSAPVFVIPTEVAVAAHLGDRVAVDGAEARHAATVTRLGVGEPVELVDGRGRRLRGTVEAAAKDALSVRIEQLSDEPVSAPALVVVQALLKGEHGDLALDQLTQIGADEIVPWAADHAVVQLSGERAAKAQEKWRTRIVTAAKQSRRARWPELSPIASLDDICGRVSAADLAVVLHEGATAALAGLALPEQGTVVLVVGPEGGIAPRELDALRSAGAHIASLGPTVLRGSLAGAAGAAVVLAHTRWPGAGMAGSKA